MKKILVPVDGSKFALNAVEKAKELAKAFDSEIILLNIIPVYPGAFSTYSISEGLKINLLKEAKINSAKILDSAKKRLDGYEKVTTVSLEGNIADEILNYAKENDVDMIIMGSQGLSNLHNIFIGSVTRKVALQATKPIMIIR